jgi:hypothetical protein
MFAGKQKSISLPQSPCCLELVSPDVVIVGTYELDASSEHEWRNGSLFLVGNDQLNYCKECPDGGVFNLQVIHQPSAGDAHVAVAHSNGCLALYKVSPEVPEITTVTRHETGSSLLSSVNVIPAGESTHWLCVGASDGQIHVYKLQDSNRIEPHVSFKENDSNQPVWGVQAVAVNNNNNLLISSGSDDCTWKLFLLKADSASPELIYTNKDARSGVTCIHMLQEIRAGQSTGTILIGSYDEKIRSYSIALDQELEPQVVRMRTKHIPGSGVWRMRSFIHQDSHKLLIAGMYSGIHVCDPDLTGEVVSKDWAAVMSETSEGRQLIYDVVRLSNGNMVVSSFSEKCLHILSS